MREKTVKENNTVTEGTIKYNLHKTEIVLPIDPTVEELAIDWTLSEEDKNIVLKARGDDNIRRLAIQLCVLRKYGRFIENYRSVSIGILGYINNQLELQSVTKQCQSENMRTETEYKKQLCQYLRYRALDLKPNNILEKKIFKIVRNEFYPENLFSRIEEFLKSEKIVLPPVSELQEIVNEVFAKSEKKIFQQIAAEIPMELRNAIDKLLVSAEPGKRTNFSILSDAPPEAKPKKIAEYMKKYQMLPIDELEKLDLNQFPEALRLKLSIIASCSDIRNLRKFDDDKKYAVIVVYLKQIKLTYLDNLIFMHKRYIIDMQREARNQYEKEHKKARRKLKSGVKKIKSLAEIYIKYCKNGQGFEEISKKEKLKVRDIEEAIDNCNLFLHLEDVGILDKLHSKYGNFRHYFPDFLNLNFAAEHGSEFLLEAIEVARKFNSSPSRELPVNVPIGFVPLSWRKSVLGQDRLKAKRTWEISLGIALKDALVNGNIYVRESKTYRSFWSIVDEDEQILNNLGIAGKSTEILDLLKGEFNTVVSETIKNLHKNPFVKIKKNGDIRFRQDDALTIPKEVKKARQLITSRIPKMRIEKLLKEVDKYCRFTDELKPIDGGILDMTDFLPALRAAVTAHGTNLGIYTIGNSNDKISVDMLRNISKKCLRNDSIKNANTKLVNYINSLDSSINLGSDLISSSDGQRFGVQGRCLFASLYPRYFGYYDKAVSVYTHVSRCSAFSTLVICCGDREAWYVLDGLLENDSDLRLEQHHTDTHGYSDHVFALSYLLGFSFMPRLAKLHKQSLYKIDKNQHYGALEPMFKGTIDMDLITEQWEQMVRIATALKNRVVPAHVIVQKLAASSSLNRLSQAIAELGKLAKTIYILRYIDNEAVRRQVHRALCYGEQRQGVAGHIFFANKGMFRSGDKDEIMNKASCLSLISNAIVCWNAVKVETVIKELKEEGHNIPDSVLAQVYPLFHEHVIVNGVYDFS
jgi:TnpA family transposase